MELPSNKDLQFWEKDRLWEVQLVRVIREDCNLSLESI